MEKDNTYFGVKEIARRANVSIATVDRVIHNRTGVSEKTKKKINEIIKELDYQPNILASRLASRKIISLAVLLPKVSAETDFWEAPLKGTVRAQQEIKKYGVQVSTFLFDLNDHNSFNEQTKLILAGTFHGVLLAPSFVEEAREFAAECTKLKIPFAFIDSDIPDQDNLTYIGPHLFQSGYVGAKLLTYRLKENHKVLVVNISKDTDTYNYLQIEEGFRSYFKDHNLPGEIIRMDIKDTDNLSVTRDLKRMLHTHEHIEAIFVTNSRVSAVASFLEKDNRKDISLIGYDFLKENIRFLNEGLIDFLICHKPEEQGYRGLMALYQTLVLGAPVEKMHFMPIDIITKENQAFYQN
ncbi:LacI family DNA-binding transcriptional regulator [Dyadobacter chenhuakuii]|uniref:LacI family transcriptional regulator n=1 Tax=Dyadobacter chenhuakuii TaxID=2909339 RepID=A0ABY4XFU4_9BACT|nr:LacI family DNA-binding transcriptional regulator [Dyadobacter chenhuakuii]MCF2491710.1 LacI family transcriptional regulator [Dyadobacter chenhuakuii]USJ29126.1 LacI family transcriptional regulator [Dyadobacter chenhuakuii]